MHVVEAVLIVAVLLENALQMRKMNLLISQYQTAVTAHAIALAKIEDSVSRFSNPKMVSKDWPTYR